MLEIAFLAVDVGWLADGGEVGGEPSPHDVDMAATVVAPEREVVAAVESEQDRIDPVPSPRASSLTRYSSLALRLESGMLREINARMQGSIQRDARGEVGMVAPPSPAMRRSTV